MNKVVHWIEADTSKKGGPTALGREAGAPSPARRARALSNRRALYTLDYKLSHVVEPEYLRRPS